MAGQPSQGNGESPLDKERQRGPTEAEKTPEKPSSEPDGSKPKPQDVKPNSPGPNPPTGENRPGSPRLDPSGPPVAPGSDAERWGMLPERVQQVFNNQISDDLPLQYRDWIDAYYKRLNTGRR